MKKIGIIGGTFNPIHNGHINLAICCHSIKKFDEILVVPAAFPPHKTPSDLASYDDRFYMCFLATKAFDIFTVCDIEKNRKGKCYTIDTIEALQKLYNDAEFYFIMGSDMLLMLHEWHKCDELLTKMKICTSAREKEEYKKLMDYKNNYFKDCDIEIFDFPVLEVSSTEIRDKIKKGQDVSEFLCVDVQKYIKEKGLYRGLSNEWR